MLNIFSVTAVSCLGQLNLFNEQSLGWSRILILCFRLYSKMRHFNYSRVLTVPGELGDSFIFICSGCSSVMADRSCGEGGGVEKDESSDSWENNPIILSNMLEGERTIEHARL